jgi:hypothetical protein
MTVIEPSDKRKSRVFLSFGRLLSVRQEGFQCVVTPLSRD